MRLCSDSPPAVVDSYFGSLITDDLYSSDRDNFCDAKDCLSLNKSTLQQIADACRISPKSNYSHTCHHLLTAATWLSVEKLCFSSTGSRLQSRVRCRHVLGECAVPLRLRSHSFSAVLRRCCDRSQRAFILHRCPVCHRHMRHCMVGPIDQDMGDGNASLR